MRERHTKYINFDNHDNHFNHFIYFDYLKNVTIISFNFILFSYIFSIPYFINFCFKSIQYFSVHYNFLIFIKFDSIFVISPNIEEKIFLSFLSISFEFISYPTVSEKY